VKPATPQPAPDAPRIESNTSMKGPFIRLGIDFAVAVDDLKIDPAADGVRLGLIDIVLVAYDRDGKPLNLGRSVPAFTPLAKPIHFAQNALPVFLVFSATAIFLNIRPAKFWEHAAQNLGEVRSGAHFCREPFPGATRHNSVIGVIPQNLPPGILSDMAMFRQLCVATGR
jgi:hypothetical protein